MSFLITPAMHSLDRTRSDQIESDGIGMETPDRESETQTEMTTNPSKKQNYCFPPPFLLSFCFKQATSVPLPHY